MYLSLKSIVGAAAVAVAASQWSSPKCQTLFAFSLYTRTLYPVLRIKLKNPSAILKKERARN
ncbi:hypothetical protein C1H46_041327 [Malus baccata]|uniref:Secreted protein n=1 Tax=Malus baccata TaxID=106549 RepID=A0A540KFY8_MALBA|nr:hypothetical protein C1H46_041327 [Malus baccata]